MGEQQSPGERRSTNGPAIEQQWVDLDCRSGEQHRGERPHMDSRRSAGNAPRKAKRQRHEQPFFGKLQLSSCRRVLVVQGRSVSG
jgi:hypothetical protein